MKKIVMFIAVLLVSLAITSCNTSTTYTVTFDANGGSSVSSQQVKEGEKAVEPKEPTRDGYEFVEWRLEGEAYDFNKAVTKNMTLVATWNENAKAPVTITVTSNKDEIKKDGKVALTVKVEGLENTEIVWSVSHPDLVKVNEKNELVVIGDAKVDTIVTVTATSKVNPTAKGQKSIKLIAPVIEGQVGELTSDMLKALGNPSITVKGVVTDYYEDFNMSVYNTTHKYDTLVTMNNGAWNGSWSSQDDPANVISDFYRQGSKDNVHDQYGNVGHSLDRVHINKQNELVREQVKDYTSVPAVWEAQHLWNHLANLQINKFTYDAIKKVYKYNIDPTNMDDLYLMTYLSFSLTPVVSDTLVEAYLVIENGVITKFLGQTEILYYGADTRDDADAMSYTTVELNLTNVGTTTVEDPKPFEAPENADLLKQAFEKMANSKNYIFHAKDTQLEGPHKDDSEYQPEGKSVAQNFAAKLTNNKVILSKIRDHTSSKGYVGCYGEVTEQGIVFATTGKYDYAMDDKLYHTEHSGFFPNSDGTYDEFVYDSTLDALKGVKKVKGNMFDAMPKFNLSPNIFEYLGNDVIKGKEILKFKLRETSIVRDVAMELSYHNGSNGLANGLNDFTVTIDTNGNLVSAKFPYVIGADVYAGYTVIEFFNVGTTKLAEDTFTGYASRVLPTSWDQLTTKYYSPDFNSNHSREENTGVVIDAVYGESKKDLPSLKVFLDIFGDNVNGPFYEWHQIGTTTDGNPINSGYIGITVSSDTYDKNARISKEAFDTIVNKLTTELGKEGFKLSAANTDTTGGETGLSNRYVCFIKGDIQIVIENNHTRYFWIDFYKTGEWTLNR